MTQVAPSILSADFARLGVEVADLCVAGADFIHMDVMDGHFVPNLTFGAPIVKAVKPYATVPLDVHLMMSEPARYIDDFILAGADRITIHVETNNPSETLNLIRTRGAKAGICLKPDTPVEVLEPFRGLFDFVLVMTVEPGFGGQTFMENLLPKIGMVKAAYPKTQIMVDGGINLATGLLAVQAGADILVAGNYILKNDYRIAISALKELSWQK